MAGGDFQVGDVVQLISGGPKMTITEKVLEGFRCAWFAGAKHESAYFPAKTLKVPDAEPKKK